MASLVRFDPYRDMSSLREDMNRLFARAVGETRPTTSAWSPALDVVERDDEILIRADLAGLTAEDIDVQVDDDVLTISGERRFTDEVKDDHYYRLERAYGSFQRSVSLPQGVESDAIAANAENGVLEVRVPKSAEVQPRKIAITTGS